MDHFAAKFKKRIGGKYGYKQKFIGKRRAGKASFTSNAQR